MPKLGITVAVVAGLLGVHLPAETGKGEPGPARNLIVLANQNDEESVALAQFYAQQRRVPTENIVALPMPLRGTVTWREFVDQIHEPLQQRLARSGQIDVLPSRLTDGFGRRRRAISGHRISYLVVCRGVPWRIGHDPTVEEKTAARLADPRFLTNQAAVDSELSLLARGESRGIAFEGNPLFANNRPNFLELAAVIKVCRLDGPTAADARQLVLSAIAAEQHGLTGRYFVDLGGPTPEGDAWLQAAAQQLQAAGFEGEVESTPGLFGDDARLDGALFYFGWYAPDVTGPFRREDFRFVPGAVALHIHSFSAADPHSTLQGWCGALVARGVTATCGNVFEPFLQLTLRPDLLVRALLRGSNFGDAAYYATPVLSWQGIAIGDPLYRPFPGGRAARTPAAR